MSNYYEMLKVQPSASSQEIEAAIEQQYNQWRRLTTHHDPNVVNQSNQALALIDKIRQTLTDPARREVYDNAIGITGQQIGGIIDPDLLLQSIPTGAPLAPPAPRAVAAPGPAAPGTVIRADVWVCPKCQHPNAVGAQFCAKCGVKVGNQCPNCDKMTELANNFCPYCGVDKVKTYQNQRAQELKKAQNDLRDQQEQIEIYYAAANRLFAYRDKSSQEAKAYDELRQGRLGLEFVLLFGVVGYLIYLAIEGQIVLGFAVLIVTAIIVMFFLSPIFSRFSAKKKLKEKTDQINQTIHILEQQIKAIQARVYPD